MISKVACAHIFFLLSVQMISALFPQTPLLMQSPPSQNQGRKEFQNCPSLPPFLAWLAPGSLKLLRSVVLKSFRKRAPALPILAQARVPGAQWAVGQQCGDTGGLSPGQSMTCAGSRAHLFLCAARSRIEEGALLLPQPEVLGEPYGRPRLPSYRAGCLLGSKTDL